MIELIVVVVLAVPPVMPVSSDADPVMALPVNVRVPPVKVTLPSSAPIWVTDWLPETVMV